MNSMDFIVFGIPLLIIILICFPIKINEQIKDKLNVARVLSVIVPGLGHIYIGKWVRGIAIVLIWILFVFMNVKGLLSRSYIENNFSHTLIPPLVIWTGALLGLSGLRKEKQQSESL